MKIKRTQLPVAPDFSRTAYSMQGFTLNKAIVDLNFDSNTDPTTGYVALSRVRLADDILIMQPFERSVFMKGPIMQVEWLHKHLKGEDVRDAIKTHQEGRLKRHQENTSKERQKNGKIGGEVTGKPGGTAARDISRYKRQREKKNCGQEIKRNNAAAQSAESEQYNDKDIGIAEPQQKQERNDLYMQCTIVPDVRCVNCAKCARCL